jgi:phosphoglycolate phosphatase-like HAD superfamily hydrolase
MIKLVAFDWNGTILADTAACLYADNEVLKVFGHPPITLKRLQETFDIPISKFWENLGLKRSDFIHFSKDHGLFMGPYLQKVKTARTRSGVTPILKWLSNNNIPAIIFSNHILGDLNKHLRRLKIENYFKIVLARNTSDNSHYHERNKEQKLLKYIKKHKIHHKEVVCVGDTCEEIDIAKQHGMISVAITGGNSSPARLRACKPDFLIHNLVKLENIIRDLNLKS